MNISLRQILIVLIAALVMTVTLQQYVGKPTLYSARQGFWRESTLNMHEAILRNQPPQGTSWLSLGANGTNTRFGIVFLAELLHRLSRKSLFSIYYWLDNFALVSNFILLFLFFSLLVPTDWALMGAILFYFLQITTYLNHYFHPWDRISLSFWIVMLSLTLKIKEKIVSPFPVFIFLLGMCIKYDLIVVPVVASVFLFLDRKSTRASMSGPILFFMGCGFLFTLGYVRPNGVPLSPLDLNLYKTLLKGNFDYIKEYGITYPPLLVFFLPVIAGALGWRSISLFGRVCFCMGILGIIGYFFTSWFHETRAEVPFLLLIFPATLEGLKSVFSSKDNWFPRAQHS